MSPCSGFLRTCVADTGIVYLDADLMSFRRSDLNVLDSQVLAGFPCYGGLVDVSA